MKVHDVEQGSPEWLEVRLGKATASNFTDILATTKAGVEAAGRKNYRTQLAIERLTGKAPDHFTSKPMEWGQDTEELALTHYTLATGNEVRKVGFIEHESLLTGASPDGLIGEDGGVEIKCMNTANHIAVLQLGDVPAKYKPQIQGNLWISGRKWWDFVSFDPDMPENSRIFIKRIERDQEYIDGLASAIALFLAEVDDQIKFIERYKP